MIEVPWRRPRPAADLREVLPWCAAASSRRPGHATLRLSLM